MSAANVPQAVRYKLFRDCSLTMTKLDWLTVIHLDGVSKTRIEHWGNKVPQFAEHLRTWGEAGTVKTGKDGKSGDRGIVCMLIGYPNNHDGDVYRMWNATTGRVTETRDVIFFEPHVLQQGRGR